MKLVKGFYNKDARVLAKELLGKTLVRIVDGNVMKSKIVETEAYIGAIDKASHAYGGRRTERLEALYGPAGLRYVYFVYGMHYCFNIISGIEDEAEGVLIRAVEPLEGEELMAINRYNKPLNELTKTQIKNLTNGPAKLCKALLIDKSDNMKSVIDAEDMYLEENDNIEKFEIVEAKRVGIDYAEEARDFLWRYYINGNPHVSKV